MIKEDQIYIGNKFIGDINYERFEIIDLRNDNGVEYVVIRDRKKKEHYIVKEIFKDLLISEDWRK